MRRGAIGIAGLAVLLLGAGLYLFAGHASAPAPTAVLPVGSSTPAAPGGTATTALLEITVPAGWQYTAGAWPPGADMQGVKGMPQVMAWREGSSFAAAPVRLSIIALPRNQLPLDRYVADLEQQLSNLPGAAEIVATIVTDLRQDGLPAGKVTYTLATETGILHVVQAALIDPSAQNFIIASLVAPAATSNLDALLQEFVQTLQLRE